MTPEQVRTELEEKGLSAESAARALKDIQSAVPSENLAEILRLAQELGVPESALMFTPTIARGLDYYTGMIFEVTLPGFTAGSVGGGGRYDNLIGSLSGVEIPAVGMAFGFDRTVEAALELGITPEIATTTQVLVTVFEAGLQGRSAQVAAQLRQRGINTELYPGAEKFAKQMKYANKRAIPFVAIIGPEEAEKNIILLKNMKTGEQTPTSAEQLTPELLS